jgi:hypothetical protein
LEQNEIALLAPRRTNAMLTRQWGEMMFFFCSYPARVKQPLGWAGMGKMPGGL